MSNKTAIFQSENNESAPQTVRQTMSVSLDDDGTPVVTFATNRGKGSGGQTVPVSEYQEVVETLVDYAENGIPEGAAEEYSPAETIRRTIRVEDGLVSFRTRSGKGSKPAKIPAAQFIEVAQLLASTMAPVTAAGEQLSPAAEGEDEE